MDQSWVFPRTIPSVNNRLRKHYKWISCMCGSCRSRFGSQLPSIRSCAFLLQTSFIVCVSQQPVIASCGTGLRHCIS